MMWEEVESGLLSRRHRLWYSSQGENLWALDHMSEACGVLAMSLVGERVLIRFIKTLACCTWLSHLYTLPASNS